MDSVQQIANTMDTLLSTHLAIPCEVAHYVLVITSLKQNWEHGKSRSQPMTTWLMTIICCFGGSSLVNLLVGNPALTSFTNKQSLLLASAVWWACFYWPKDLFSSAVKWTPLSLVIIVFKEMIRTRKILKGISLSRPVYPSSLFLCTFLGMLGACGGGFIKTGALVLSSHWNDSTIKTFSLSKVTKSCLLFSLCYNLQLDGSLPFSIQIIALVQATWLSAIMLSQKFGMYFNPFHPLEKLFCSIFVDYSAFTGEGKPAVKQVKDIKSEKQKKIQ